MSQSLDVDDTIVAIATAPGGSLRGIVRISGPDAVMIAGRLVRLADNRQFTEIKAPSCVRGTLTLENLDDVPLTLYLWPTSRSYTRQPSVELHLPGSPPILETALAAACRAGARLARPGEFTLRAFLAGRLDLTQAEAVLGIIDAGGRRELDAALAQLAGGLARPLAALREKLLDLLADVEAGLDFAEEDIEFITCQELDAALDAAAKQIAGLAAQMQSRSESSRLPRVVLVGLPNVGKSSLLNALVEEQAAIVSPTAGTTRDFVSHRIRLGAREYLLIDTAGVLRASADELAAAAQRETGGQVEQADLMLFCLDSTRPLAAWECDQWHLSSESPRLAVWTKCDLPAATEQGGRAAIRTSSRTGLGLPELRSAIAQALQDKSRPAEVVAGTADRCRESLRLAGEALQRARASLSAGAEELVAAEVRIALDAVGEVSGAVYTEDLLDRVFSKFCIGK